jgi:hypothetical protein
MLLTVHRIHAIISLLKRKQQTKGEEMEIKTRTIENTWLDRGLMSFGWGNGYIGLPKEHPWYGIEYDEIECDIHGGLTYGCETLKGFDGEGFWWIGFDTSHYCDTLFNWPEQEVIAETKRLERQAWEAWEDFQLKARQ